MTAAEHLLPFFVGNCAALAFSFVDLLLSLAGSLQLAEQRLGSGPRWRPLGAGRVIVVTE
ncbi:MAG: hypothetical protein IPK78_04295 [Rhodospirillales bacterium]|nr:hypothetical protein [Rhodospirillales bacterium]